jgi:hypothetical protein
MKPIIFPVLLILLISCGNDKKTSGGSSTLSSSLRQPSTVDGFFYQNGLLEIAGGTYQMVSSLSGTQINQQLLNSNTQPITANGSTKYRARLTGAIYNPCQQGESYHSTLCQSASMVKYFYVTAIQFN